VPQQHVNVGIIGGGLMGREVAAAIARWPALGDYSVRPVVTAVCDVSSAALAWFDGIDTVKLRVSDYRDLLASDDVDVVYVAVRHDLHEEIYLAVAGSGKDLLGEKPFGIDLPAAERIVTAITESRVFARCSSEMPFFPGAQAAYRAIASGDLGPVIEAYNGFHHSSDLDPAKPINWKRQVAYCGEAGVMNDLGMHVCHVPLRLGWRPAEVYGVLQNLVDVRPDADGKPTPCDTWDNATLICTVGDPAGAFPLTLATKRIDPGQKNSWEVRVTGLGGGVAFSTRYPKTLRRFAIDGGEQVWQEVEVGSQSIFPTVTGGIFETGFSDAILQMLAAYFAERDGFLGERFGCVTPQEALDSHRIFAAAMESSRTRRATALPAAPTDAA
jgi:predicted dehydrogenase